MKFYWLMSDLCNEFFGDMQCFVKRKIYKKILIVVKRVNCVTDVLYFWHSINRSLYETF